MKIVPEVQPLHASQLHPHLQSGGVSQSIT
jgi:hypothetical protein